MMHPGPRAVLAAAFLATVIPWARADDGAGSQPESVEPVPDIVLLTLDTTRADAIGVYGGDTAVTPNIDRLAARGLRYERAISPAPLTLPAHASLLTGLTPPEHGARDNGRTAVDATVPLLAEILSNNGYHTAAFVASRVLDERFGLGRGFEVYDDSMVAENVGEYGYAERDAAAVTDAAIAWLDRTGEQRPFFLWVHYYDPHSPYRPPEQWRGDTPGKNYAGEISFVDHEIGRLLSALPGEAGQRVVAVVGDHGEALGEHGERTHGIFLYDATLHVPLIIAGPGLAPGRVVETVVSTRQLAPTLVALSGATITSPDIGTPLPRTTESQASAGAPWVYSETLMPANAYGWSPLSAWTDDRWRYIDAPRAELYDLNADPGELDNVIAAEPVIAERLRTALIDYRSSVQAGAPAAAPLDEDLISALEALGYVSRQSTTTLDAIDPKDGMSILSELEQAKDLIRNGKSADALPVLQQLHDRNPSNVIIMTHLARAQLDSGQRRQAIETYRRALEHNPDSEFIALKLSTALARVGDIDQARQEARRALAIDPRSASAWMQLADLAENRTQEIEVLTEALAAECNSALVLMRLADIESRMGRRKEADRRLAEACRLAPGMTEAWIEWARIAELRGSPQEAAERYRRGLDIEPENAFALLRLGIVLLELGELEDARKALTQAVTFGSHTEAGQRAQSLLQEIKAGVE